MGAFWRCRETAGKQGAGSLTPAEVSLAFNVHTCYFPFLCIFPPIPKQGGERTDRKTNCRCLRSRQVPETCAPPATIGSAPLHSLRGSIAAGAKTGLSPCLLPSPHPVPRHHMEWRGLAPPFVILWGAGRFVQLQ